jgi:hypothetical protein
MKIEGFHLESGTPLSDKLVKRLSGFRVGASAGELDFSERATCSELDLCIRLEAVRRLDTPCLSDIEHVAEPELRLDGLCPVAEDAASPVVSAHQVKRPVLFIAVEDEPCALGLRENYAPRLSFFAGHDFLHHLRIEQDRFQLCHLLSLLLVKRVILAEHGVVYLPAFFDDDPIFFVDPPPRPVCQGVKAVEAGASKGFPTLGRVASGQQFAAVSVIDFVIIHRSTFSMLSIGTNRFLFSA